MHRRFPANFIETSSQGASRVSHRAGMRQCTNNRMKSTFPPNLSTGPEPRREFPVSPVPSRAHPAAPPPHGPPAQPSVGLLDETSKPVANQCLSCTIGPAGAAHRARAAVPHSEAEIRTSHLAARASEALDRLVDDSRGIGSCTAPRQGWPSSKRAGQIHHGSDDGGAALIQTTRRSTPPNRKIDSGRTLGKRW